VFAACFREFMWARTTKLVDSPLSSVPRSCLDACSALTKEVLFESFGCTVFQYDWILSYSIEECSYRVWVHCGSIIEECSYRGWVHCGSIIEECSYRGWIHCGSIVVYTEVDGFLDVPGTSAHCLYFENHVGRFRGLFWPTSALKLATEGEIMFTSVHNLQYGKHLTSVVYTRRIYTVYRVSQEECARLRESVP
jgi:hypothetical protein